MNRSGYTDECDDPLAAGRWIAAVNSSLRGRRGQAFLRELLAALDAMPEKRLIANTAAKDGCMCALAVVAAKRGQGLEQLDAYMKGLDWDRLAESLDISEAMAREVMYLNDEMTDEFEWVDRPQGPPTRQEWDDFLRSRSYRLSDSIRVPILDHEERRWRYMRDWAAKHLKEPVSPAG